MLQRYKVIGTYRTRNSNGTYTYHRTSTCFYANSVAEAKAKARQGCCANNNIRHYTHIDAYRM